MAIRSISAYMYIFLNLKNNLDGFQNVYPSSKKKKYTHLDIRDFGYMFDY